MHNLYIRMFNIVIKNDFVESRMDGHCVNCCGIIKRFMNNELISNSKVGDVWISRWGEKL